MNKMKWPMTLSIIGAIYSVVVGFIIAYISTGGKIPGIDYGSFEKNWLLITIMAIVGPVIGLIGASTFFFSTKVSSILLLIGVVEYIVVASLIGSNVIPYLLIGGIGPLFMLMGAVMGLLYPYLETESFDGFHANFER